MTTPGIGNAELLLISDFEIDEQHIALALALTGRRIDRDAITILGSGRSCTWPLQVEVPDYTSIRGVGSHLWHIANYLHKNRETVQAIHSLGCNLQLNVFEASISPELSISASTLKRIGDLEINLVLQPSSRTDE